MKKLYLLLFISLALLIPRVGFAQGTDTLEPAEYKPPQVGTRIEYSKWTCTVEEVDGFRTKCRLDEGGSVTLFAWLQVEGKMPRSGYHSDRSWIVSGQRLLETRLKNNETRLVVEKLWPLEVGKNAQYTGIVQSGFRLAVGLPKAQTH